MGLSQKQIIAGGAACMWAGWVFIAAICLMAGTYQIVNLDAYECFYGGVSTEYTNGLIKDGVSSRACQSFTSLLSCGDLYDLIWANASLSNGAGDPLLNANWQANDELRDYQLDQCEDSKHQYYWIAGWTMFFMLLTSWVTLGMVIRAPKKAGFVVTILSAITVTLLLRSYSGPVAVSYSHYDCKGMANEVYGDPTCGVPTPAPEEGSSVAFLAKPNFWLDQSTLLNPKPLTGGKQNFGGTLPSCITGLTGYDEAKALYAAPGPICITDQAGNNADAVVVSFRKHYTTLQAGIWMGLLAYLPMLAYSLYSAYDLLIVNYGDDDDDMDEKDGGAAAYVDIPDDNEA